MKFKCINKSKNIDENHGANIVNLSIGCIDKGVFLRIINEKWLETHVKSEVTDFQP